MTSREAAAFFDFVQIAIWAKRGPEDMRYGRTGSVGAPVGQRAKRTKIST